MIKLNTLKLLRMASNQEWIHIDNYTKIFKQYFNNGFLQSETEYYGKKRHGCCKRYYKTGEIREQLYFKYGIKDGLHKQWYNNGKPIIESYYVNGEKDGEYKTYYKNGNMLRYSNYNMGRKYGDEIIYNSDGTVKEKIIHPDILLPFEPPRKKQKINDLLIFM